LEFVDHDFTRASASDVTASYRYTGRPHGPSGRHDGPFMGRLV